MNLITWNSQLETGISQIDKEHKHLVELINKLYTAMSSGQSKTVMGEILTELVTYGAKHFATEEKYFKQTGYSDASSHIAHHESFKAKASKLLEDYHQGKTTLSMETLNFLMDWVTKHIKDVDMKYVDALKKAGIH